MRGRPRKNPQEQRRHRVVLLLTDAELAQLKLQQLDREPVSITARRLLKELIDQRSAVS